MSSSTAMAPLEHLQGFRQSRRQQHPPRCWTCSNRVGRPERLFDASSPVSSCCAARQREHRDAAVASQRPSCWSAGAACGPGSSATTPAAHRGGCQRPGDRRDPDVLAIAERLIERRSARVDRAAVFVALAASAAQAPPGEHRIGSAGPRHPRCRATWHPRGGPPSRSATVGGRRGSTRRGAVVARLRTPGQAAPRGLPRRSPTSARGRRLAERRVAEREQLRMLIARMRGRGPRVCRRSSAVDRMSSPISGMDRACLRVTGRADGRRRAASSDGRVTIDLREPGAQRALLRAHRTARSTLPDSTSRCSSRDAASQDDRDERQTGLRARCSRRRSSTPMIPSTRVIRRHERELAHAFQTRFGYRWRSAAPRPCQRPTDRCRPARPLRIRPQSASGQRRPVDAWPALSDRGCVAAAADARGARTRNDPDGDRRALPGPSSSPAPARTP